MIVKSDPYTMPAHGPDQWWRPLSDLGLTEARWVRAVEMRPSTPAGRKIIHHALAHLVQDDPEARKFEETPDSGGDRRNSNPDEAGTLMEWAVGKNYDIYRENTGKLLLPGSHVWWDVHYHAVGEQLTDQVELAMWLYPKGQEPNYRTYLTNFGAQSNDRWVPDRHTAQHDHSDSGFPCLKSAGHTRELPATHAPARQSDVHGSHPA